MGRMASINPVRMVRALLRLGWTPVRVAGSHYVLKKQGHPPVTVPVHRGRSLKEGTARAILEHAGIGEQEFFDEY